MTAFEFCKMFSTTFRLMQGMMLISEMLSENSVNTRNFPSKLWRRRRLQQIEKLTPTSPSGPRFGDSNATILLVLIFVVRLPRKSLLPKKIVTSGIWYWPAIRSAPRKLSTASVLSSRIGI